MQHAMPPQRAAHACKPQRVRSGSLDQWQAHDVPALAEAPGLRAWRLARALTQRHLAQQSGLSVETVRRLEIGGTATANTLRTLAAALHVAPQDLMRVPRE